MSWDVASWRRWNVRHGLYAVPAAVVTVVVLLVMLVLIPNMKAAWESWVKLRGRRDTVGRLERKLEELRQLSPVEVDERVGVMERVLPSIKDVGTFLLSLRTLAEANGLTVADVEIAVGEIEGPVAKIGKGNSQETGVVMQVTVAGTIEELGQFLDQVPKVLPVMEVKELAIAGGSEELQVKLTIEGYYWPMPATLAAAEKPLPVVSPAEQGVYAEVAGMIARDGSKVSEGELPSVGLGNPNLMGD